MGAAGGGTASSRATVRRPGALHLLAPRSVVAQRRRVSGRDSAPAVALAMSRRAVSAMPSSPPLTRRESARCPLRPARALRMVHQRSINSVVLSRHPLRECAALAQRRWPLVPGLQCPMELPCAASGRACAPDARLASAHCFGAELLAWLGLECQIDEKRLFCRLADLVKRAPRALSAPPGPKVIALCHCVHSQALRRGYACGAQAGLHTKRCDPASAPEAAAAGSAAQALAGVETLAHWKSDAVSAANSTLVIALQA